VPRPEARRHRSRMTEGEKKGEERTAPPSTRIIGGSEKERGRGRRETFQAERARAALESREKEGKKRGTPRWHRAGKKKALGRVKRKERGGSVRCKEEKRKSTLFIPPTEKKKRIEVEIISFKNSRSHYVHSETEKEKDLLPLLTPSTPRRGKPAPSEGRGSPRWRT